MELDRLALDHAAYPVRDANATRHFYTEVLGLPLVRVLGGDDWDGHPWLMMIFQLADGGTLALTAFAQLAQGGEASPRTPADARHLALRVRSLEELAGWRSKLAANDVAVTEEDHGAQKSLYFQDPSGVVLEITSYVDEVESAPVSSPEALVAAWVERYQSSAAATTGRA